jgi:hypothetical protein
VEIEKSTDLGPEMFADSAKLSSLIEFMKCYPAVQKKEKGHGSSNQVTSQAEKPSKASVIETKTDDAYVK